jgi:hypothetical protein
VEQAFVDMEDGKMYAGSLEKGMIAICNPTTGKVEKDAIFCGDEDREAMQISVLKIDRYASRVLKSVSSPYSKDSNEDIESLLAI